MHTRWLMEQEELNLTKGFWLIHPLSVCHSVTVPLGYPGICFAMKHLPPNLYPAEPFNCTKRYLPKDLNQFGLNVPFQCTLASSTHPENTISNWGQPA